MTSMWGIMGSFDKMPLNLGQHIIRGKRIICQLAPGLLGFYLGLKVWREGLRTPKMFGHSHIC